MSVLTRPGVYQRPVRPTRRIGGLARRDVPVLIGFATRGPALEPVRIESVRQFAGVFGEPFPTSHLADAVKGFFETGGTAAYVVRLTGAGAAPARHVVTTMGGDWRFEAHSRLADLARLQPGQTPMQWQDHLLRRYRQSIPDPGGWGNALVLRMSHVVTSSRMAEADADHRDRLYPVGMAGMEVGTVLVITQGARSTRAEIAAADPLRREITLASPLPAGFATGPTRTMSLAAQSLTVEVRLNGGRVELFENLAPSPRHASFFASVVNGSSRFLRITGPKDVDPVAMVDGPDGVTAYAYPAQGDYALSGGTDGLTSQTPEDWLAALGAQTRVDEIALIAAPDLVRQATEDATPSEPSPKAPSLCHLPIRRPPGNVAARVIDAQTAEPIGGVRVEVAGEGAIAQTNSDGTFLLEGVTAGLVELRLIKDGYLPANALVQASADQTGATLGQPVDRITTLQMIARDDVPVLNPEQIRTVQRAMCEPDTVGAFRIAVLDPPGSDLPPEDLLNWVATFDRTARGFAAAPWIGLAEDTDDRLRMQPPSGHVCGAFALAEQSQGVHRAPGNMLLRHVKAVPLEVSDAIAAEFHRAALNLVSPTTGRGIRLMGARTLSSDPAWTHVSVRRLFDALERTLLSRMNWAVFEPNTQTTRAILKFTIEQLLERMRRRGMFAGSTPDAAFAVNTGADVNPAAGRTRGELVAEIAVAPTQPYEFISFSLSAQAEAIEVTERT